MIALLGLGPRSVDESKSATANSCVATKPSRPRIGVPVYQNSSLLRPSAPFVY
ncbi:hypothetical protein [Leptospira noguchii]|uniref:hypothetical protein n=1 Tax=Leptospira noguchii TaxID=28182 RepID=UPI0018DED0E2|nr:hypothetical protein [Leptospira noguchii]